MPTFVTGASGFLGLRLVMGLLERGRSVVALAHEGHRDRPDERFDTMLTGVGASERMREHAHNNITYVEGDITKPRLGLSRREYSRLTKATDEVWHCAASITLRRDSEVPLRANVAGTQEVLRLIDAVDGPVRFFHISTVYVVGATRDGYVVEAEVPDHFGFENNYVKSKHEAEGTVMRWAERTRRPTTIFRTSLLITDRPFTAGVPTHTLATVVNLLSRASGRGVERPAICRWPVNPMAHTNLVPVEFAADVMLRAAELRRPSPTGIFHVVNPADTPLHVVKLAIEQVADIRIRGVPGYPASLEAPEKRIYRRVEPLLPVFMKDLTLSTRGMADAGLTDLNCPVVDLDYLRRSLHPAYALEGELL